MCYGRKCFDLTFLVSGICAIVSAIGLVVIGRKWKV